MKKEIYITPKSIVMEIDTMSIIATSNFEYTDNNDNNNNGGIDGSDDEIFELGTKQRFYHSYDMVF